MLDTLSLYNTESCGLTENIDLHYIDSIQYVNQYLIVIFVNLAP